MRVAIVLVLSVTLFAAPASAADLSCNNPFIGELLSTSSRIANQRAGVTFPAAEATSMPGEHGVFFQYRNYVDNPQDGDPMCMESEADGSFSLGDACPQSLSVLVFRDVTCTELAASLSGSDSESSSGSESVQYVAIEASKEELTVTVNGRDATESGGIPVLTDSLDTFDVTLPEGSHCLGFLLDPRSEGECVQLPVEDGTL